MAKPTIDYDIMRRVAEMASANRYNDIVVVVRNGDAGNKVVIEVQSSNYSCPSDDYVCFPVSKVDYRDSPPVKVAVIGGETATVNLLELTVPEQQMMKAGTYAADAVFWSQSAVEKFLIPYYASVYGDQADAIVNNLLNVLKPAAGSNDDNVPFAIAHLPASEYVTVDERLPNLYTIHSDGGLGFIGRRKAGGGS